MFLDGSVLLLGLHVSATQLTFFHVFDLLIYLSRRLDNPQTAMSNCKDIYIYLVRFLNTIYLVISMHQQHDFVYTIVTHEDITHVNNDHLWTDSA